jgi:DNA-binding transcriptional MerR regulator
VSTDAAQDTAHLSAPAAGTIAAAAGEELARAGESVARVKSDLQSAIGRQDLQTIGSVVERLREEFPDLSVSKVRYLEEQGLITPRRTRSGYRLFSPEDYERLHSVLTLQRDQYLPLKVIRRELDKSSGGSSARGVRRSDLIESAGTHELTADELVRRLGAEPELLAELEEYEIVRPRQVSGVKRYSDIDAAIVAAAADLARVGLRPKNLRILKSAVDRETGLIEQVVLPVLRSPRMDHQREALDLIQAIVSATSQLRQLLIARNVRRLTSGQPPV